MPRPRSFRFPILFTGANRAMWMLGIAPSRCRVDVTSDMISVRFAWAFRADLPRAHLSDARRDHGKVGGWGVHGWRGSWLVNGSARRLVALTFDPPGRARMCGLRVTVRRLRLSLEDPAGFLAAVGHGSAE